jgi:uncharacterized protein (DUF1499 family)
MHLVIWIALAVVAVLLAARFGAFSGSAPSNLGVRDGKLKPPSKTPNSVTSQADAWPDAVQRDYARIAPIALVAGDGKATIAKIAQVAAALPGARFVDDTEFWFDPAAQAVQVRSASRVGRKDFGVNRARIEQIRERLGNL